jgi:hypothetical protein
MYLSEKNRIAQEMVTNKLLLGMTEQDIICIFGTPEQNSPYRTRNGLYYKWFLGKRHQAQDQSLFDLEVYLIVTFCDEIAIDAVIIEHD